jgi:hypothetical protein
VEKTQVDRAMDNIRAEVVDFEKEGVLRGTVSAAEQANHLHNLFHYIVVFTDTLLEMLIEI